MPAIVLLKNLFKLRELLDESLLLVRTTNSRLNLESSDKNNY